MESKLQIPEMVHPLGKAWSQPDRSKIKFSFGVAWVDQKTFDQLAEYSSSLPSGVYEGKMWRRKYVVNGFTKNLLCWYDKSDKPDQCSIKKIDLIIDKK